jgi:hypothetical protein
MRQLLPRMFVRFLRKGPLRNHIDTPLQRRLRSLLRKGRGESPSPANRASTAGFAMCTTARSFEELTSRRKREKILGVDLCVECMRPMGGVGCLE